MTRLKRQFLPVAKRSRCSVSALACLVVLVGLVSLDSTTHVAADEVSYAHPSQTLTSKTTLAFKAKTDPVVSSNIVYLEDIVEPLNPNLAAWKRLRRATVTLVPVSRDDIRIDRDRLSRLISEYLGTGPNIDWIGPSTITVKYREESHTGEQTPLSRRVPSRSHASSILSEQDAIRPSETDDHLADVTRSVTASYTAPAYPVRNSALTGYATPERMAIDHASSVQARRTVPLILNLLHRRDRTLANEFSCSIDPRDPGLLPLKRNVSLTSAYFIDDVATGDRRVEINGYLGSESIRTVVNVVLAPHPQVVVPARSIRRGQRISRSDLAFEPMPEDRWDESFSDDVDDFIGLEASVPLRAGTPIRIDQLRSPVLVRRNEVVSVRVNSGRFRVTTEARAKSDGSKGELIEIETINPRRSLFARVNGIGSVEITSRPSKLQ